MHDLSLERVLPNNLEAERTILGSILLDPPALFAAQEHVRESDFYTEAHRIIFRTLGRMQEQEIPLELLSLKTALSASNNLEACGGAVYLVSLTDGLARGVATAHYAKAIRDLSIRRHVIRLAEETMSRAYMDEDKTSDIIERVQMGLLELASQKKADFRPMSELIHEAHEEIERIITEKRAVTGLETGFRDLDIRTGGLHRGELIYLAGRPGHGKSALAGNIADHNAVNCGKSIGVFSLEMPGRQLAKRSILGLAEVDSYALPYLYDRTERESVWKKIQDACGSLSDSRIFIDDSSGLTIAELRSKAQRLKIEHDIDLLIVDYLQLMSGSSNIRNANREREISEISRGLKRLAGDLDIPVLALSQLNRNLEHTNRKPQLSDLRESGSLEQDADVVLFIWREEMREETTANKGMAEVLIGKQRSGQAGIKGVDLVFLGKYTKFRDAYYGDAA